MALRAATLAAAVAILAACAGRDPVPALLAKLAASPGTAPDPLREGESAVLVALAIDGTDVVIPDPPILQPGAKLRLERALLERRTNPPTCWVVVTSPDGRTIRYWCATADEAAIRGTLPDRGGKGHRSVWHRARGSLTSVRVPFVPSGRILVYTSSGSRIGAFRFGPEPEARVAKEP